jgi:uncharacterized protein YdaT
MPLKDGSDNKTISENIAQLIKDGFSRDQAIAIAHAKAKRPKAKK